MQLQPNVLQQTLLAAKQTHRAAVEYALLRRGRGAESIGAFPVRQSAMAIGTSVLGRQAKRITLTQGNYLKL